MDQDHFDALARGVSRSMTRRKTLRRLASGLMIALPGVAVREEVAARCVSLGRKCDRQDDKCCNGAKCRGRCKCRRGKKACDGACISATECCASAERPCGDGCILTGTCCPDVERTCGDARCVALGGCCSNAECNGGVCEGGSCHAAPNQRTCTARDDGCTGAIVRCAAPPSSCTCVVRPNGLSFCSGGFGCADCASDADCERIFGVPGSVCVQGPSASTCGCGPSGKACMTPCMDPA